MKNVSCVYSSLTVFPAGDHRWLKMQTEGEPEDRQTPADVEHYVAF